MQFINDIFILYDNLMPAVAILFMCHGVVIV